MISFLRSLLQIETAVEMELETIYNGFHVIREI